MDLCIFVEALVSKIIAACLSFLLSSRVCSRVYFKSSVNKVTSKSSDKMWSLRISEVLHLLMCLCYIFMKLCKKFVVKHDDLSLDF